jgi:hypothetical protein
LYGSDVWTVKVAVVTVAGGGGGGGQWCLSDEKVKERNNISKS